MYDLTYFYFYKFQFLIELILAESIFLVHLKRKKYFALKSILCILVSTGLTFAIPIITYDPLYTSTIFFVIFIISLIGIAICFDESIINIIFCGIAGYTVQHIAFCFYQVVMIGSLIDGGASLDMYGSGAMINGVVWFISFYIFIITYAVVYILSYLLIGKKLKKQKDFYVNNKNLFALLIVILIAAILLNSYMVHICTVKEHRFELLITFIYGMLSCSLVLMLQFTLKDAKKAEKELEIVSYLWKEDKEHYELAKENIDIINIKCHDLKHQLSAIRHGETIDAKALKEVENSISIYGSIIKTGNDALDVVLTEKSLLCNEKGITLTYIADGE
ncbi:MAG: hypothetical protein RSA18_03455, partial [Bacilli bacterium]